MTVAQVAVQFRELVKLSQSGTDVHKSFFIIGGEQFTLSRFLENAQEKLENYSFNVENIDESIPEVNEISRCIKLIPRSASKESETLNHLESNLEGLIKDLESEKVQYPQRVRDVLVEMQQKNLMKLIHIWIKDIFDSNVVQELLNDATNWKEIEEKVFEQLKSKCNTEGIETFKNAIAELLKIYADITAPIDQEIKKIELISKDFLEGTEKKYGHTQKLVESQEKKVGEKRTNDFGLIVALVNKIYVEFRNFSKNWKLLRHDYLEGGVCLGACVSSTLKSLKEKKGVEGLKADSCSRFLQANHLMFKADIPLHLQDLVIELFELLKIHHNIFERIRKLIPDEAASFINGTEEFRCAFLQKHQHNSDLCDQITFFNEITKKLNEFNQCPKFKECQDTYSRAFLSQRLLRILKFEFKVLNEKPIQLSDFFKNQLPALIDGYKNDCHAHFILTVKDRIDFHIKALNSTQDQTIKSLYTTHKLETMARNIVGDKAPASVIKRIMTNLALKGMQSLSSAGEESHGIHSIYLSLKSPFVFYDVNVSELKDLSAPTIEEFKLKLFSWFMIFPYQTIQSVMRVTEK